MQFLSDYLKQAFDVKVRSKITDQYQQSYAFT